MNAKTEKRKDFLINLLFIAAVLGLAYVFLNICFGRLRRLCFLFICSGLAKARELAYEKCKGKGRGAWSVVLVLLSIAIILVPVILLLNSLVNQIKDFSKYLMGQLSDFPQFMSDLQALLLKWLSFLPDSIYSTVSEK